jgi:flagellin
LTLDEEVTREQCISKLKESTLTPDLNYTANTTLKMADNYVSNPNVTLSVSGSMTYFGGIASGKDLNAGSDSNHIKPNPTTGDNREGIDKFNFTLTKDVDTVSANSTFGGQAKYAGTVHVSAHDQSADKEGIWWEYEDAKKKDWNYKGYSYSSGDLTADIASALSGTANNSLINDSAVGGTITLNFDLKTTESVKYSYTDEENAKTEGDAHDKLGTIALTINVGKDATAKDVTDAIAAIKGIDIASTYANNSMGMSYGTTYYGAPVYGGTMALNIQAGSEGNADNVIPIIYDVLNNHSLKINDLNTTTVANAQKGIEQTKNAKTIVDEQRAVFGSYQNRMEHTYKNLTNVVENTQNAESLIRDTDMAAEMVRFSNNNILMQAGQSMLAQANQTNQGVLSLLQ